MHLFNIKEKIKKLSLDSDLSQLENNILRLQEETKTKKTELENILLKISENKHKENIYINQIHNLEKELLKYKDELYAEEQKEIINIEAASVQFHNYLREFLNNYEIIFKNIKENLQNIEQQKNILKIDLISLMKKYIDDYHLLHLEPKLENFIFFMKEYNFINSKNLIQYEQEAKELSIKTEIIFKEEFINKLKKALWKLSNKLKI